MIDTTNTDATQDNARTLNGIFAGKQVVNSRDLDLPARSVAFTTRPHVHHGSALTIHLIDTAATPHLTHARITRHKPHNPTRRTVRPVDGQTRAKRTPGRVIARKHVRSPYSEPEREMRQACADHTWTNEAHNSYQRSLPYSRVRARARGQTHKKQWGAWHLETPDHAPHTITR